LSALQAARVTLVVCVALAVLTAAGEPTPVFLTFEQARPVIQHFAAVLPSDLKSATADSLPKLWPEWVRRTDARIRDRLARGDVDSLINLLMFGSSFTTQPRLTARRIEQIVAKGGPSAGSELDAITAARMSDFLNAARQPGANERFAYVRRALASSGYTLDTPAGITRARTYLLAELSRVLKEIDANTRTIEEARQTQIAGAEFAERSRLYRSRGLSSDTSLPPNFALEEALKNMQQAGRLSQRIRRVAIVGPGLDFTDKQEGYDFYPEQTLQPFAVADSLMRMGLSDRADLRIVALDLNPRVHAHLAVLHSRSTAGNPYVLQLPIAANEEWNADFLRYWQHFGDQIGRPVEAIRAPASVEAVKTRAVAVRPDISAAISDADVNIVVQQLPLPAEERFDLIVATNVFVYYDDFEKALALLNVDSMLRPGGVLLSNNALVDWPSSRVKWVGNSSVRYSDQQGSGDTIVWYQK